MSDDACTIRSNRIDGVQSADSVRVGVIDLNGHAERVGTGIDEAREASQWHDDRAELAPLFSGAIALLAPEDVERPHEGCSLSAVVVESQELETGIVAGAQVAFNLVFIAEHLQATAGHEKLLGHRLHAVIAQQVAEDFKITGFIGTRILADFLEVGEGAPLALLVGDDGRLVGHRVLIIAWELDAAVVIVVGRRCRTVPLVESSGSTLDVILRTAVPSPAATDAGTAVELRRIILTHLLHPVVAVVHPVAGRLVAGSHHHERRMVAELVENTLRLLNEVVVNLHAATQADTVVRPRRTFHLQVEAQTVGNGESRLRRAVAVEADVVQAVLLTLAEDTLPRRFVGRWIARLGETAVLDRTSQEERATVDVELTPLSRHLAQSEGDRHIPAVVLQHLGIEPGIELIPQLGLRVEVDAVVALVDGDVKVVVFQMGHHPLAPYIDASLQLDTSDDAVPVALRLVGDAVGVLPDADVLDAVVDAQHYLVRLTEADDVRHVIAMGRRQRHLPSYLMTVDVSLRLNVCPLQEERYGLTAPLLRHVDLTAVPCRTDIVALWRQEEGKLHLAFHAVLLHIGIEVVRRVVERACPLCLHADRLSLAVGQHRAGQHDVVRIGCRFAVADSEVPRAIERNEVLGMAVQTAKDTEGTEDSSSYACLSHYFLWLMSSFSTSAK